MRTAIDLNTYLKEQGTAPTSHTKETQIKKLHSPNKVMCDKKIERTEGTPQVLTPKDVAVILGVSRNTAYEVFHTKDFPMFTVGKQLRVRRECFFEWMDNKAKNGGYYDEDRY